ncbi:MAG: FKBP-type peptidyl-prolyl cis-trans isomerase [Micropepsaceae bacterium]
MDRIFSILALVAAIGAGAYTYMTTERVNGEVASLKGQVETLKKQQTDTTRVIGEVKKDVATQGQQFQQLVAMLTGEQHEPTVQLDMDKLTDEKNAEFLADFARQDRVVKLPSGAMYRVEKEAPADAKQATPTSTVTVHYSGAFIDGTIFDSSYERGEPATFPLQGLIPGWLEILPMMKEGDTWQVALPYTLGYGEAGRGNIPPRQTLVFKIELIKVDP